MNARDFGIRLHTTLVRLAADHDVAPPDEDSFRRWNNLPDNVRSLYVAVGAELLSELRDTGVERRQISAYLERTTQNPQAVEADRRVWQARLGALLTLVEARCEPSVVEDAYLAVNTNPSTGNVDEPYADIATLTVRAILEPALAAGLIVPGPNAPGWLREK